MDLHPAIKLVEPSIRCRDSIVVLPRGVREDENPISVRRANGTRWNRSTGRKAAHRPGQTHSQSLEATQGGATRKTAASMPAAARAHSNWHRSWCICDHSPIARCRLGRRLVWRLRIAEVEQRGECAGSPAAGLAARDLRPRAHLPHPPGPRPLRPARPRPTHLARPQSRSRLRPPSTHLARSSPRPRSRRLCRRPRLRRSCSRRSFRRPRLWRTAMTLRSSCSLSQQRRAR
jgi:hypothetical protein